MKLNIRESKMYTIKKMITKWTEKQNWIRLSVIELRLSLSCIASTFSTGAFVWRVNCLNKGIKESWHE